MRILSGQLRRRAMLRARCSHLLTVARLQFSAAIMAREMSLREIDAQFRLMEFECARQERERGWHAQGSVH